MCKLPRGGMYWGPRGIHDICPFLSTDTIFGSIFLHIKVRESRQKISTKQRKWPKIWFYNSLMQQNTINCTRHFSTLQIFFTFLKWRAFSIWKFITWRISPHDNLLREEISPHDKKFSTGTACGACDKYQVWWHLCAISQLDLSSTFCLLWRI